MLFPVVTDVVKCVATPKSVGPSLPACNPVISSSAAKVALTFFAEFIVVTQAPVLLQAPPQPTKKEWSAGRAVKVTTVPAGYSWLQAAPQRIPLGLLTTVPGPFLVTVKVAGEESA